MVKRSLMKLLLCLVQVIATVGMVGANGPELMVYSGSIPQGVNQGDGSYEIGFSIYNSEQGGSALWTETQNVYIYQGTFAVYLGAVQKLNLAFDEPYWVGVKVGDKEDIWPLTGAGYPASGSVAETSAGNAGMTPELVAADEVKSANIKEADGTTAQNTNTGSGIKTNHIQDAAVTTAKIKNSAVNVDKIAANAVTTPKIAAGAVTDAKITGPISGSKISSIGLNADKLDGLDSAAFVKKSGATMTGTLNLPTNGLVAGTDQLVLSSGRVGIGTTTPAQKLSVAGTIESTTGGVKFPDSTVQTTAANPSWSQIISGAGRWKSVLGGTAALDRETGLVWQKQTDATLKAWMFAENDCYQLGLGGRRGWRLPTIDELSSLVDTTMSNPALPAGHPFTDEPAILLPYYWSSTISVNNPDVAWGVIFSNGTVSNAGKDYEGYVRCVRGGQ